MIILPTLSVHGLGIYRCILSDPFRVFINNGFLAGFCLPHIHTMAPAPDMDSTAVPTSFLNQQLSCSVRAVETTPSRYPKPPLPSGVDGKQGDACPQAWASTRSPLVWWAWSGAWAGVSGRQPGSRRADRSRLVCPCGGPKEGSALPQVPSTLLQGKAAAPNPLSDTSMKPV